MKLPTAVLVELDGTLAHLENGRKTYDWGRVGEDTVDTAMREIVNTLAEPHHIILLSGRDASCTDATEKWLNANSILWDELLLREPGDSRRDAVIKRELFDRYIRNTYNVIATIDAREQSVHLWRSMGIKCLQVDGSSW